VLSKHEDHLMTLQAMAALEGYKGNLEATERWLRRAVETHPDSVAARLRLANHLNLIGQAASAVGLLKEAPVSFERDPAFLLALGSAQLQASSSAEEAVVVLRKLVDMVPQSPRYHYLLSRALRLIGDAGSRQQTLETVLRLDPGHLSARNDYVWLLLEQGQSGAAATAFEPLWDALPEDPGVKFLAGVFASIEDDPDRSVELLAEAFEARPDNTKLLFWSMQEARRGNRDKGFEILEQWVGENPGDVRVRLALADAYAAGERTNEAIAQLQAVLEKSPDNVTALNNLAWFLKETSPEKALVYAERAFDLAPDNPNVYDTLARVQLANQNPNDARQTLERALTRYSHNPSLLYLYGTVLAGQGDNEAALSAVEKALREPKAFPERDLAEEAMARLKVELEKEGPQVETGGVGLQ
jgi:tetratricopeptide (TPR) repeat protein